MNIIIGMCFGFFIYVSFRNMHTYIKFALPNLLQTVMKNINYIHNSCIDCMCVACMSFD